MKILGNRVLFLVGLIWVISVFIIGTAFLLGNPHYFEESAITGLVLLNIFGFGLWSIPGFVLIILGKWKSRRSPK